MRRALSSALFLLCACEGMVGEYGEAERPPAMPDPARPRIGRLECTPLEGYAPLDVACDLEVTHPQNKPVQCSVDPGNGDAALPIADCLNPQHFELTFATVGAFTVKVVASDPEQGHANASVVITATQRPNQPPTVDDFTAAPVMGGAPFTSTLSWSLTDPEGDALTCKLNDATVDCAAGRAPFTVQSAGTVMVTLTVTDAFGGTATKTLALTAVMAVGDVRISKVEWAQSVVLTDLKLVASKPALLRVHLVGDKATFSGVTVVATGKLGSQDLGMLTLTGPATVPTAEAPADLGKQWTVTVPADWVAQGLEVTVKADAADALPETDETNNVQVLKPLVGKANVMALTALPVVHQGNLPTITSLEGPLTRIWPLKGVDSMTRAPYTYAGTLTGGNANAWGDLLDDIAQVRQMDGSNRNYYGFVKVAYGSGVAGIGFIGQEAAVGRDDSIDTAQHELGHNMGRQHAPCGGPAGPDPSYPYAGGKIGSWGYDAVNKRLVNPATAVDLMSYCDPAWVSDYNYKAVQRYLETQPYIPPSSSAPFVTAVALAGRIGPGGVTLRPVHRVRAQGLTMVPFTGRTLKVRFASGLERVVAISSHELADLDSPQESFFALVEGDGAIASIEVFDASGRVFAGRPVFAPEAAPRHQVTRLNENTLQLEWDAVLYPTAAVAHLGADGVRTTLALGLTSGRAAVRVDGLGEGKLELSLSEGLDAAAVITALPAR
ncbi:MAG: hypothetical protein IPJ65_29950 [Archangiaceae bacterium]|nr:hypothetical protein [Archangiaceae bacterium]